MDNNELPRVKNPRYPSESSLSSLHPRAKSPRFSRTLNKIAIESLSMDLLRAALGYHKGSNKMANRFVKEALKRCSEVDKTQLRPNFVRILNKIPIVHSSSDTSRIAEDALMYSTLLQNAALTS